MMATPLVRAVRGAITCPEDTPAEITVATQELLTVMMERNELEHDDVISVIFTTTSDLTSAFPATCARGIGFGDIPLLCASEIDVPGSMARCIRILLHAYTSRARTDVRHVYLRGAQSLRDDLPG
jgi:chorismate mutase